MSLSELGVGDGIEAAPTTLQIADALIGSVADKHSLPVQRPKPLKRTSFTEELDTL